MKIKYQTGFTQIPNSIIRNKKLTSAQKIILMVLCSYANDSNIAYPSYNTIAKDSGVSRRKVISVINDLVMLGCINKTERRTSKGDNAANDYEVLIGDADFALHGDEISALPGEQDSLPRSAEDSPRGAHGAPNLYINNKINKSLNNIYQQISEYDYEDTTSRIKSNIDYDVLISEYPKQSVDDIIGIITDTICANAPTQRISGSDYQRECVRSRLLKLDSEHIRYVLDVLKENTTQVRNIKAYLLTALYNAPTTMDSYYMAKVNYDMSRN